MKNIRRKASGLILSLLAAIALVCGVSLTVGTQKAYAVTDTSASAVVRVGELTLSDYETRTDGKVFDADNLSTLYQYLTGISNASLTTVKNKVSGTQTYGNSTIAKMLTSSDISKNVGALTGTARDIVVSFGGYEWTVTSLTTDENGDPIVTLWLAESDETSVWQNYTVTTSTTYGTYPPNMYATSYIRTVTLNAGGYYGLDNTNLTEASQDDTSKWAKFTMTEVEGSLTSFIDTPSQVKYQEVESWPLQVIDHSDYTGTTYYYLKSDSYGTPDGKYGSWYSSESTSNYATYTKAGAYYDNWKNDYLWLPSLTETGREYASSTNLAVTGIWEASANQKANSDTSWLRSGFNSTAYGVVYLTAAGSHGDAVASTAYCVRPALHLNLNSAALGAAEVHNYQWVDEVAATCETSGVAAHYVCTECGAYFDEDYNEVTAESLVIPATGHAYGAPVWSWSEGNTSATATFTCANDASHTVTETATVTDEVTTAATCGTAGVRTYTATVTFNNQSYETTKTESIPALGHDYGEPVWNWSADGKSASATVTCSRDPSHTVGANATVTGVESVAPDCETAGKTLYTAKVTLNDKEYTSTKEVQDIPALGHNYQGVVTAPTCTEQGYTTYTCTHDNSHTYDGDYVAALGHDYQAVVTDPTCTEQGYTTYTCAHDNSHTYVDDYVAATGHDYAFVWSADNTSATYVCRHDATHTLGVTMTQETTAPTCEDDGYTVYTATVDGTAVTDSRTVVNSNSALGHAYGEPVWSWDGTTSATATFTCATCGDTQIVDATVTEEITTYPTTEATGVKTITAKVVFEGKNYSAKTTETIAKLVSDESGKGDVVDLPPLTDPDDEYELEITVKATDKQYNMDGVNKGYEIALWIVNGDSKTPYDKSKTVTLSLVVPEGMEEFTLYRVGTDFEEVDESEYTVEGGILTIRTTLSAEFVFHADKADESSASNGGMAWYWWLIIALIVVAIIVIILIIILKKRKKKGDPEKTPETVVQVEKYDDAELKQRLNAQQKQIDELLNRDDDGFNDIVDDK